MNDDGYTEINLLGIQEMHGFLSARNRSFDRDCNPIYRKGFWGLEASFYGRIAFWLLKKCTTGFWDSPETTQYRFMRISHDKIIDRIFENTRCIRYIYNGECKTVVIGQVTLNEIMDDIDHQPYGSFRFDMNVPMNGRNGMRILGMEVIVVPWIEGLFVMPEFK